MEEKKNSYKSKAGFKVPENYFEDLEFRLMEISSSREILNKKYKGNPGFKVPDNYFEEMEKQVLQKVDKSRKGGKVLPLLQREIFYYAAAVAAILLLVVPSIFLKPSDNPEFSMDAVEMSSIDFYINNGYIDFNFNEISSFLSEEDYILDNFNTSNISDEDVFYYLTEHVENPGYFID